MYSFYMTSFKNIKDMNYKIYEIDTLVEFDRYKGRTIIDIAVEDKNILNGTNDPNDMETSYWILD